MKFELNKLINSIIFFYQNTDPLKLNKTKILKLLFFFDFIHIEKYGRPVINDTYYHLPLGPIPSLTKNIIDNMKNADESLGNDLKEFTNNFEIDHNENMPPQYNNEIIKPIQNGFNDIYFSDSEIEILKEISKRFYDYTAKQMIDESHKHPGYVNTDENDIIDFRFGFKRKSDIEYFDFWEKEKQSLKMILNEITC